MNKKILFLGYDRSQTSLIQKIEEKGYEVDQTDSKVEILRDYSSIISFGYRHIISEKLIKSIDIDIINLHSSYLPWNRGAHANFWSFYDHTPKGITIHVIDKGIDTGPILFQKLINFNGYETTFSKTYNRLRTEIENLFIENMDNILNKNYVKYPQKEKGSYHETYELPKNIEWDSNIEFTIKKLKNDPYNIYD